MRCYFNSYFRNTSLRDVPEKRTVGSARRAHSQQPRGTCYGTMPWMFIEQCLPSSQSSGGTQRRFLPPERIGEMKLSGHTASTIHLPAYSGTRILPMPASTGRIPRLYTTLAVPLGSL